MIQHGQRRIRRSLRQLLGTHPFFGSLALRLPVVARDSARDMATDGENLYFNPQWAEEATADVIRGAVAKCVTSCALKHTTRRGERDREGWQIACHFATLPILKDAGFTDEESLFPEEMSAEQIYNKLPPGEGGGGEGEGNGSPSPGEILDAPRDAKHSDAEHEAKLKGIEQDWDHAAQQAVQLSKAAGKDPGKGSDILTASLTPQASWEDLLRRFMTAYTREQYTWSRPNRRFIASGLYLPALHSEAMGHIVFAIDTSGSMDKVALQQAWSELRHAVTVVPPSSITVIQTDSAVQSIRTYDPMDLPEMLVAEGRGGTAFAPTFEAMADMAPPACLVYFTDMGVWGDAWGSEPDCPVLWLVQPDGNANAQPPFGEVVAMMAEAA